MEKATGGKTQHGRRPSPRLSVRPEHSVQAGAGRAQAGPRAAPQAPPALQWGAGTALERLGEMFQQNDLLCIFKGILSIFLHCPPSFAFRSGLTPRTRGGNAAPVPCPGADLETWGAAGKGSKGGGNTGESRAVLPQRMGRAEVFLPWNPLPPWALLEPRAGAAPRGLRAGLGLLCSLPSPCPTWVPWIRTCLRQNCLLADALKTHLDLGFTLTM